MTTRQFGCLVCFVFFFGCADSATALFGEGDSPYFSINTQWISSVENQTDLPRVDRLGDSYPNPFNPLTKINFELVRPTTVNLRIYDMKGRLVRVLVANELLEPGLHFAEWDGRNSRGAKVAAGVYLYRLLTDTFSGSKRMTLVK